MIHRNTYVNAPLTLEPTFETRRRTGALLRGTDVGRRGLRRVRRLRPAGRPRRLLPRAGRRAARLPRGHRPRRPRPLHRAQRPRALPAHQHRLRPPAGAPAARPGQGEEAPRHGPPGPREPRPLSGAPGARRALRRRRRRRPASRVQASTAAFLRHLERERNASPHTIRAYGEDLAQFADHLRRELGREPRPEDADHLAIRGFLAELHRRGLAKSSSARKLAGLRTFFRYLCREGRLETNPARVLATPRKEKRIPARPRRGAGPGAPRRARRRPRGGPGAARSWSCSTPPGSAAPSSSALDVGEVDLDARMVRVLGKGRKERIVLFGHRAQEALRRLARRRGRGCGRRRTPSS